MQIHLDNYNISFDLNLNIAEIMRRAFKYIPRYTYNLYISSFICEEAAVADKMSSMNIHGYVINLNLMLWFNCL